MDEGSQTVGRVSIELGPLASSAEPYRAAGLRPLRIRREAGASPARRPIPIIVVIGFVNVALSVLAGIVRSWPAIGAAVAALGALVWLATSVGKQIGGAKSVELELDEVLRGDEVELAVSELRKVGVGQGGGHTRTVWVSTRGGRQLLLEALSDEEAQAAAGALEDAIARRQSHPIAATG
ncbi:MAG: hypothetical protein AB8I08_07640 [Sandaracinaceae bacterium]